MTLGLCTFHDRWCSVSKSRRMSPDVEKSELIKGREFASHALRDLRASDHSILGILHYERLPQHAQVRNSELPV